MSKTIDKSVFVDAIAAVTKATNGGVSSATKIATITATADKITIKATNHNEWMSIDVAASGDMDSIQVDAKALHEVVSGMRGTDLKLSVDDGHLTIVGKGRRKIAASATEYPAIEKPDGVAISFDIDVLRGALSFVYSNISDDASKMNGALMGAHIHNHEGVLRAVSVAGNSCACMDIQPCADQVEATLSKSTIGLLDHVTDGVIVDAIFGENMVSFTWGSGEIIAKRIDGAFPNYQRLVPAHDHTLHITAKEMREGLSSIAAVATDDKQIGSRRTLLHLGPQMDDDGALIDGADAGLIAQAQGREGTQPLDAEWTGPNAKIAFAARVMSNVLSGFVGELEVGITPFEVGEQPKPMLIRQKGLLDRFAFMMPLKSAI